MDPIDLYTARQAYLEGYKEGLTAEHDNMFDEISAVVILLLNKLGVESLGELTKRELRKFQTDVNTRVRTIFGREIALTLDDLKRFVPVDVAITAKLTGATAPDAERVWSGLANDPVAGVGETPAALMDGVIVAGLAALRQAINIAYADHQTMREIIAAIVGTKDAKFRDGVIHKMRRQYRTAAETVAQHTAAYVAFKLGSLVSKNYTWCSILDSRTTDICRGRNGNVYEFATGPRPPAHWRCRSFIIPIEVAEIPTYRQWLLRMPTGVQDDIIGVDRGRRLRKGDLGSDEMPGFDYTRPLTLEQYEAKLNQILEEVA